MRVRKGKDIKSATSLAKLCADDLPTDMPIMVEGLTPKQVKFVEHYLQTWNGSQSARAAGYNSPKQSAHRIMQSPKIRAAIEDRLGSYHMSADEVLARLSFIATGSIADFIDDSGSIDLQAANDAGKLGLIKRLKVTSQHVTTGADKQVKVVNIDLELHDPLTALNMLGKRHNFFNDRFTGVIENINPPAKLDLSNLTDDQLEALARGLV